MMRLFHFFCNFVFLLYFLSNCFAKPVVNVYVWGGEIPKSLLKDFENETHIHVNFSTYDSNETMVAKLRASKTPMYDVILPSAYFVDRLKKQHLLQKLDHTKLPNLKHLAPSFQSLSYDSHNHYSIPFIWGATGIFYNQKWIKTPPLYWTDLWKKKYQNQLMILDDSRDLFGIALLASHYSVNDHSPAHIKLAYDKLKQLFPNIKLFANEGIQSILIDEDAIAGIAWNGDVLKAQMENPNIHFVYPKEGYVIWIDCLAIPKGAPHQNEAHAFINFLLNPKQAEQVALIEGHAITNQTAIQALPKSIRTNQIIYPPATVLARGIIQRDIPDTLLQQYHQYWQALKSG